MVTARKPHQCDACARDIEPGAVYVRTVAAGDGISSSKLCPKCQALLQAYFDEIGYVDDYCFSLSELRSIVRESLLATGTWGRFKKAWRAALARGLNGSWHT